MKTNQEWKSYRFNHVIHISSKNVIFNKRIESNAVEKSIIHPYSFTFNPKAWDKNTLCIKTHNGGENLEIFNLKGQNISHGDIYSSLISARHGFGNTEGMFVVGDKNKTILFTCDMASSALIPSIVYKEMLNTYFFRLQYSAQEMDETVKSKKNISINIKLSISFN